MRRKKGSKPELKIYSFFSETAKEVGLKTDDVEEVYLWAIREMKKQLKEDPSLSVNINSFGKFVTDRRTVFRVAFQRVYLMKDMIATKSPEKLKLSSLEYHASVIVAATKLIKKLQDVPKYSKITSSYEHLRKQIRGIYAHLQLYDCEEYPNLQIIKTNEQLF